MIASGERGGECVEGGVERFEAAGIVATQRFFALKEVQGSAFLRAGFGEDQGAVGEFERGQRILARRVPPPHSGPLPRCGRGRIGSQV